MNIMQKFRDMSLAKKIGLGSIGPLVLIAILSFTTTLSIRSLGKTREWVEQAFT